MATKSVHPGWYSCFPGGVHRDDDGVTPDLEEPTEWETVWFGHDLVIDDTPGEERIFTKSLSERLTDMGF